MGMRGVERKNVEINEEAAGNIYLPNLTLPNVRRNVRWTLKILHLLLSSFLGCLQFINYRFEHFSLFQRLEKKIWKKKKKENRICFLEFYSLLNNSKRN